MRTVQRRGANHVLHVVLTLLTCGVWAVTGWPIAAAVGRRTVTDVRGFYSPQDGALPGRPPAGPAGSSGPRYRCLCGAPIEWMAHPAGSGWIHSPGSGTPCLEARPA